MIVKGVFSDLLKTKAGICSPVRHFFARLGMCEHAYDGEKSIQDYFIEVYAEPENWRGWEGLPYE